LPRQFDIVENRNPQTRKNFPYVIVRQSDRVTSFGSTIVAPRERSIGAFARSRIHPTVEIDGVVYVVLCERLAAVRSATLGRVVGTGAQSRYQITAALDMLFTGI
jgi:toxin CcdB